MTGIVLREAITVNGVSAAMIRKEKPVIFERSIIGRHFGLFFPLSPEAGEALPRLEDPSIKPVSA
ncbi:hypothetical protein [Teichococcus vastitatis]|uniref:hypothetical protein n=1 Tax=Teichococcus vastitatis TaxID=2307076 RepID=UPI00138FF23D|nr:hypothetical protein [Pseudoroseomonas vastitatis]